MLRRPALLAACFAALFLLAGTAHAAQFRGGLSNSNPYGQPQNPYIRYSISGPFQQYNPTYPSYNYNSIPRPFVDYSRNASNPYEYSAANRLSFLSPEVPLLLPITAARIEVLLPSPDAELWFDGKPTTSRGIRRSYETPELIPGSTYSYTIKISWTEEGQPRTEERLVQVTAGARVVVDFTQPAKKK